MLKQKSNPWARLKFLYVLPLAAVTVAAFAHPEISRRLEKVSDVELVEVFTSQQNKKVSQAKKQKAVEKLKQDAEPTEQESVQMKQGSKEMKQKTKAMKEEAKQSVVDMKADAVEAREDTQQVRRDAVEARNEVLEDKKQMRKDKPEIEMAVNREPREEAVVIGYGSMKQQDGKVFDILKKISLSCVLWNLNRTCALPKVLNMLNRTRLLYLTVSNIRGLWIKLMPTKSNR